MAQMEMFPAVANSPATELTAAITDVQTTVSVLDASKLPDAPNIATIGVDESAETVRYEGKSGNDLTGVTRGFSGTAAKAWGIGVGVARYFTAYDADALRENVAQHSAQLTDIAVNVKYYGAIGDGASHPLSAYYSTLTAAQAVYPVAVSLDDELDWCALQTCVEYCFLNRKSALIPEGEYLINRPLVIYTRDTLTNGISDVFAQSDWVHIRAITNNVVIRKTTHTTYSGVDCVVYVKPYLVTETTGRGLWIENITLCGSGTGENGLASNTNPYGIYYSTQIASVHVEKVMLRNVDVGEYGANPVYLTRHETVYYWTKVDGVRFPNVNNTSNHFVNCYAQFQTGYGYYLSGVYSSLTTCASDAVTGTCYGLFNFSGMLNSCGAESPYAYCVFEAGNSHVSITGDTLANVNSTTGCRHYYSHDNAYVTVISGKISATGLVGGVPTQLTPSGKLFVIASNGRIEFIQLKLPVLPFAETSDWTGLQRTKFINALPGSEIFNHTTGRPVFTKIDGNFVDADGNPAVRYDMVYGGVFKQNFSQNAAVTNSSFTQTSSLNIISTSNSSASRYNVVAPINLSNFKYIYIRLSSVLGNVSSAVNQMQWGIQTVANVGTTTYVRSGFITTNLTNTLQVINITDLNLKGDYYLTFCNAISAAADAAITVNISAIVLSDIAGITV